MSIVSVSDDDNDDISFVGSSRQIVPQVARSIKKPIFIGDSDEDDSIPSITSNDPYTVSAPPVLDDRKGKRKAGPISQVIPSKSALLDLLDEQDFGLNPSSDDFANIVKEALNSTKASRPPAAKKKRKSIDSIEDLGPSKLENTAAKKAEKEAQKALEKAEKQRLKEEAKVAKEAARSLAAKEKDVNKLRTSKNDTVRELHLYLSPDLQLPSSPIAAALPELRIRIEGNGSKILFLPDTESPIHGLIRFKRHIKARYDSSLKRWVPLDRERWEWEDTVLIVVAANEIVDRIAVGSNALGDWISDTRLTLGIRSNSQLLVMIQGLQKYYNKNKALANREFAAAARGQLGERSNPSLSGLAGRPSKERIETELVKLQVAQGCFLVHVEKTEDMEDWIFNLAADIAIRPYKLLQKAHLNFCPTDGIKKGAGPHATFELMLQEVQGITPSAAAGIAAEYDTFRDLMEAYERAERRGTRPEEMLQDCEVRNLRNGTANGRRLNKALSKKVYQVFRGEDSLALA